MAAPSPPTTRLIGILGGMSPESTILYYRFMNETLRGITGNPASSVRTLIHTVDFAHLARLQAAGDWDAAGDLLADAAQGLARAGAQLLLISANTMHVCAEQVARAVPGVRLLHIGDIIAEHAGRGSKVLLLGTKYTMEMGFLRDYIAEKGVEIHSPDLETRVWLQDAIYEELTRGIVRAQTKNRFEALLGQAKRESYDAAVLGCTELGMLVDESAPLRLIDTARVHARAAVEAALVQEEA